MSTEKAKKPETIIVKPKLMVTNPKKWLATIQGTGAMLMNRKFDPGEEEELLVAAGKGRGSKVANDEKERLLWREKVYHTPSLGVYVPSENIHQCMQEGCKYWGQTIPGEGKKTYTDVIKSACVVEDMPLGNGKPLEKDDPTIVEFGKWVSGNPTRGKGGGKVWRIRPYIGMWEGTFIINTFDSRLTKDVLEVILTYAGQFKGLNDWRPKFGRFQLAGLEEINGTSTGN